MTKSTETSHMIKPYSKAKIPKAVREQVWIHYFGRVFTHKCYVGWCKNNINVFDFQVGHDKPESKGGTLNIDNLRPICSRCNLSMSDTYTITEWSKLGKPKKNKWYDCLCCY